MKGYHSRGYHPHFDLTGLFQHLCIHLSDSVPKRLLDRLKLDLDKLPDTKRARARSARIGAWMDNGYGCCVLKVHSVAEEMQRILLLDHGSEYELRAWVVMPNHVHCLVKTLEGFDLPGIVRKWKTNSAFMINTYLREKGKPPLLPVWQREYFDRYIRDDKHMQNAIDYIHRNPVKAGLTYRAENWRWSSARLGGTSEPNY